MKIYLLLPLLTTTIIMQLLRILEPLEILVIELDLLFLTITIIIRTPILALVLHLHLLVKIITIITTMAANKTTVVLQEVAIRILFRHLSRASSTIPGRPSPRRNFTTGKIHLLLFN